MIASSLALALGASVAVADPTIEAGLIGEQGQDVSSSLTDLTWDNTTANGFYIPQANGGAIENLNFTFDTTTSGVSGSVTGTTYNTTINATTNPLFKITSTQGLQMGADGQGILKIMLGNGGNAIKKDFTLDLSKTEGTTSFKGNIEIFSERRINANDLAHFNAYFGKNVEGNISIKSSVVPLAYDLSPSNFTFSNGAKLIGSINALRGTNTFNFGGNSGEITGNIEMKEQGYNSVLTINFDGNSGKIGGMVDIDTKGYQGSRTVTINANSLRIEGGFKSADTGHGSGYADAFTGTYKLNLAGQGNYIGKIQDSNNALELWNHSTMTIAERDGKAFDLTLGGNVLFGNVANSSGLTVNAPNSDLTILGSITAPYVNLKHTVDINVKSLNISGILQNLMGTTKITLNGGNSSIGGNVDFTGNGDQLSFTLNNTDASKPTTLTLKGATNRISTLTTTGINNALTIASTATGTITNLNLGNQTNITGFLTIDNSSNKALTITNFVSQNISNVLTINKGAVEITSEVKTNAKFELNNNASLDLKGASNNISTLTATGTNNLNLTNTLNTTSASTTINTLNLNKGHLNISNAGSGSLSIITLDLNNGGSLSVNTAPTLVTLNVKGVRNTIDFKGGTITANTLTFANPSSEIRYSGNLTVSNIDSQADASNPKASQGTFTATGGGVGIDGKGGNLLVINDETSSNSGEIRTYTLQSATEGIAKDTILAVTKKTSNIELQGGTFADGVKEITIELQKDDKLDQNYNVWRVALSTDSIDEPITYQTQDISASFLNVYLANFNSLNKRMGELRENKNGQGAWGRIFNGQENNKFSNSSTNFTTIQAGYDYAFGLGEGVTNYLGAALSYGFGSSGFNQAYGSLGNTPDMTSHLVEFALYNSYVQDEGWFNDTIIKFGSLMNNISSTGLDVKTNSFAFTFSDEVGYRFKLGSEKEWFIDPQFELGMGHLADAKFDHISANGKVQANADSMFVLRTRLGASAGYDFKKLLNGDTIKASAYVGLFAEIDSFSGGDITLASTNAKVLSRNAKTSFKSTDARGVINYGGNVAVKDNIRVYLDMEHSFGGQISTDYKINAGVRYSFGEKTQFLDAKAQEKKDEAKKKEETPIKLKEEEKKNTQEQTKDVKKETKAQEKQTTSETSKNEKAEAKKTDAKKTESKKADAKAGKKQTKKQVTKKGTAKKQVKKAEANKAKSANKTARTEGGDWGWW